MSSFKQSGISRLAKKAGRARIGTSGAPFCWHAAEKNTTVTPKTLAILAAAARKTVPSKQTRRQPRYAFTTRLKEE